MRLETHIFDFNQQVYHQQVVVQLDHWLRPEAAFENVDALLQQIKQDAAQAKAYYR